MAKMKLDLDGLAVESFETEPVEGSGTVLANERVEPTTNNSSANVNCICSVTCIPTQLGEQGA